MNIRPYPKNAKKHPKDQIEKLARAIEHFGFSPAIEVDADGVIVSGHGRWMAATENLGWTEIRIAARAGKGETFIPYLILDDLTPDEIKAKRLADNKLAETDVDMILAIEELRELDMSGLDIELTGYSKDLLIDPDEDDDNTPETPIEPISKLGDIYVLGNHVVACGDSTSIEDVEKLMNGKKADMVFTDPPYNVNYKGGGENTSNKILNDHMSDEAFDTFLDDVFKRYSEVTKRGGGLYVFHSSSTQHQFQQAIEKNGMVVKSQIIWNKPMAALGWGDYRWKHEPMFYVTFKDQKANFYGDRTHSTVWDFHKSESELVKWAKAQKRIEGEGKTSIWSMKREPVGEYKHPTQKPVELITYALKNSSKEDDLILDLFGGSGATMIAAHKMNRNAYLMELDPRYVDVMVTRWCLYAEQTKVVKNGIEIDWII